MEKVNKIHSSTIKVEIQVESVTTATKEKAKKVKWATNTAKWNRSKPIHWMTNANKLCRLKESRSKPIGMDCKELRAWWAIGFRLL